MFGLLFGLWKQLFRKREYYILLVGLDGAGKTSLLEQLKAKFQNTEVTNLDKISPTVGLNIGNIDAGRAKLVFWDLGGQSSLRTIWDKYYTEAHAICFVIDSSARNRFEEAKSTLDSILHNPELYDAPLLVLANKHDLPDASSLTDIIQRFISNASQDHNCHVQAVSAFTGEGIVEGVNWLVSSLLATVRVPKSNY